MKDVFKRIVMGVALAGLLFLFVWLSTFHQVIFDMLVLVLGVVGVMEMYSTLRKDRKPMLIPILAVALASYPLIWYFRYTGILIAFGLGFLLAAVLFVFTRKKKEERPPEATKDNLAEFAKYSTSDFSATLLIIVYPMLLLDFVFVLNLEFGLLPLLLALGAALVSDLFAYAFGSLIKGPKIFPTISPKKTYSGCICGLVGGAVGGLAIYGIFEAAGFPANTAFTFTAALGSAGAAMLFYALFGAAIALVSQTGDLFASRVKRELKIKDFSKLLGAHGGVMDRIDSTLLAIVPIFIVMVIAFA